MSKHKLSTIIVVALAATLLFVTPAAAQAITQTITFHNETVVDSGINFCGAGDVTLTITYNGVLHLTEFTADHPNAGAFHGNMTLNGTVVAVDGDGDVFSNDRFVKTIFHTNVNRRNLVDKYNFIVNGTRADGGRHRYHLLTHFNLSGSGDPLVFEKLWVSCP